MREEIDFAPVEWRTAPMIFPYGQVSEIFVFVLSGYLTFKRGDRFNVR